MAYGNRSLVHARRAAAARRVSDRAQALSAWSAAIDDATSALTIDATLLGARNNRGVFHAECARILRELGSDTEADRADALAGEDFDQAASADPLFALARLNRAQWWRRVAERSAAARHARAPSANGVGPRERGSRRGARASGRSSPRRCSSERCARTSKPARSRSRGRSRKPRGHGHEQRRHSMSRSLPHRTKRERSACAACGACAVARRSPAAPTWKPRYGWARTRSWSRDCARRRRSGEGRRSSEARPSCQEPRPLPSQVVCQGALTTKRTQLYPPAVDRRRRASDWGTHDEPQPNRTGVGLVVTSAWSDHALATTGTLREARARARSFIALFERTGSSRTKDSSRNRRLPSRASTDKVGCACSTMGRSSVRSSVPSSARPLPVASSTPADLRIEVRRTCAARMFDTSSPIRISDRPHGRRRRPGHPALPVRPWSVGSR